MSKRVLLAGLFHETHTFLEGTTSLGDFAIRSGGQLLESAGDGSPLSGVLEVAASRKWDVLPAVDLRAMPAGTVEDDVLEFFWAQFRAAFEAQRPAGIDGIFLVLHGAMVCRTIRDVEGELIARIRSLPGAAELPICGVLDLHGNISRPMIERSDGFVAYRTNPHTDARQAAVDAALLLDRILSTQKKPAALFEPCPVVWPPTGTGTADEPMRTLEAIARTIEREDPDVAAVNIMAGFSFADTRETGVSFSAVTFGDPEKIRRELRQRLCDWAIVNRRLGNPQGAPLEQVMPLVLEKVAGGITPVAIVEPADNIGGGAPGDAPTVLRALIEHGVARSAVVINDPQAVAALADVPLGGSRRVTIGGKGSRFTDPPLELVVELVSRSDGRFELEDRQSHLASMSGVRIEMGPCAVVRHQVARYEAVRHQVARHAGVTILLTSRKTPPFDLGQLRSQGIEPERLAVIGIKAAVAHRRAYDPITKASFTVATPGPCGSDLTRFPYQHVRRPIYPLDEVAISAKREPGNPAGRAK